MYPLGSFERNYQELSVWLNFTIISHRILKEPNGYIVITLVDTF
jgi:hypothetical protein